MAPARPTRWTPLREELARWHDANAIARLWLRDDDAVCVTPALARLTGVCTAHAVPCLIAAVPGRTGEDLATFLTRQPLAEVAAHGWTHRNHAGAGPKAEFPLDRPGQEILHDLRSARARISALFGASAVPIYVPPWNRIAPEVARLLPSAGFSAVSAIGRTGDAGAGPRRINVHLDIIDWRGSRGGRDQDLLIAELAGHLAWSRQNGQPAIGVLTHHLDHDEVAWQFLEELFAETRAHATVRWVRASEILAS